MRIKAEKITLSDVLTETSQKNQVIIEFDDKSLYFLPNTTIELRLVQRLVFSLITEEIFPVTNLKLYDLKSAAIICHDKVLMDKITNEKFKVGDINFSSSFMDGFGLMANGWAQ